MYWLKLATGEQPESMLKRKSKSITKARLLSRATSFPYAVPINRKAESLHPEKMEAFRTKTNDLLVLNINGPWP